MALFGFSVNNLSLMAMTLAIGFVVDDAIVMLENIVRHMEMGDAPMEAAFKGSKQIGFTILSMTISLAAVFLPILFMGGILGRLFHEFAVVIVSAILISGIVSLTLTPMLCSRFLLPPGEEKHGRFYMTTEKVFTSMLDFYKRTLAWVLDHRFITLMVNIGILVATFLLFKMVPTGFIPDEDYSQVFVVTETPQGTSFDQLVQRQTQLMEIVRRDPNVSEFFSAVGGTGSANFGGQNFGRMFFHLKPRAQRENKLDVFQVIQKMRPKLATVP